MVFKMNKKYNTMNQFKKYIVALFVGLTVIFSSCTNDFLDEEPLSEVTPEQYLWEESQLAAYTIEQYTDIFPSHSNWSYGTFGEDGDTDNMASTDYADKYTPGMVKVPQTDGNWEFTNIYNINYYLETVVPRWEAGEISGTTVNIDHYVGEGYFLRAFEYFQKLKYFGDFPIITEVLADDMEILTEASKRYPQSEVTRFILEDLDKAIELMLDEPIDGSGNRLSKKAAQLFKSRVALYEATWLKYFSGTAFVPNGTGWPGADKDYNSGYQYQAGSIDAEIDWLFGEAMSAASAVADNVALVSNNGVLQQTTSDAVNPYPDMFGAEDMSGYSEVLLWRAYNDGLGFTHNVVNAAAGNNYGDGTTKGMVDAFLMSNGLPIYDAASGYQGDDYIADVRTDRDQRLWLFLKEPGQTNLIYNVGAGTHGIETEADPPSISGSGTSNYTTGYALRKGINYDGIHTDNGGAYTGAIVFRASEAYLNYIEACYEKNGSLDGTADSYWRALRARAGVDEDYTKTIAATIISEEAKGDWGAYSAGNLIDATLYNIRRERRCELMAEAHRESDLRRWRAMDQMVSTPYHIEGFKLWGSMQEWYKDEDGEWTISWGSATSTVSSPDISDYLRPYEITGGEMVYNGYEWHLAHYLEPIAAQQFLITSENNDVSTSPIYQNPGWSTTANLGPIDL
jgi:hypothetical protein